MLALAGTVLAATAAPATAAPKLELQQRCAFKRQAAKVPFEASGLRPGARYRVRLSGTVVASGTVAADGTASGQARVPRARRITVGEQTRTISINDGKSTVSASLRVTSFGAVVTPKVAGRSPRERFRFAIYGYDPGGTIYLHYVRPDGTLERTFALGKPVGPCGRLVTAPRVLLPFRARPGTWRLQFDKSARYRANAPAPVSRTYLQIRTRS